MNRIMILEESLRLLEGSLPFPSKAALDALSNTERVTPPSYGVVIDPFSLIVEAGRNLGLERAPFTSLTVGEESKRLASAWLPVEDAAFIWLVCRGEDPLWFRGFPLGVFRGLLEVWLGLDSDGNSPYLGFVQRIGSQYWQRACPYDRLREALIALVADPHTVQTHLSGRAHAAAHPLRSVLGR